MREAHEEGEDLGIVRCSLDEGEAEVEGDGDRAEHGDDEPEAETGGDAVIGDFKLALDGAAIDEGHHEDIVVGHDRHLVLDAVEEHEVAADLEAVDVGADAAELEAADALEATSVEAFINRGVRCPPS